MSWGCVLDEEWNDSQHELIEDGCCCRCGGPLVELGQLGHRLHFRCRECGWDQSIESPR